MIDRSHLQLDGFTTIPFLSAHDAAELRQHFQSLHLDDRDFVATSNDLPRADAQRVSSEICRIARPVLEEVLPGRRPFLASFVSKKAGAGPTAFHQDLTYTEPDDGTTLLWIPLVDVDDRSGCLRVVTGSHRWSDGVRPAGASVLPTEPLQAELDAMASTLPLPAGHAVAYKPAPIHGAAANTAGRPRPAVAIAVARRSARLVHFHVEPDGTLAGFRVDHRYFDEQSVTERPRSGERITVTRPPVTTADLRRHVRAVRRAGQEPRDALARRGADPPPRRRRTVLRDRRLDRALRRRGFVIVPLLDAAAVERLRAAYGVLHGWTGSGFEADLNNPDTAYRRRVSDTLTQLDRLVEPLFDDHEPFLRVYLCKWPGPDSDLYIHRDWMYTDERHGHRTYVVWVALQDIDESNGPLQVVQGSHRLDPSLRGSDLDAPWLRHQDVIRSRLTSLRVEAGDAVVFDNQLLHASLPNTTDQPRLVAAVGMRSRSAALVHFRRRDEQHAERWTVEPDFFLSRSPGDLVERPPEGPVEEVIPVEPFAPGAEQVARMLDALRHPWLPRVHPSHVNRRGAAASGRRRLRGS